MAICSAGGSSTAGLLWQPLGELAALPGHARVARPRPEQLAALPGPRARRIRSREAARLGQAREVPPDVPPRATLAALQLLSVHSLCCPATPAGAAAEAR